MRARASFVLVFAALCSVGAVRALPSWRGATSPLWIITLWGAASGVCALLAGRPSRLSRALAVWTAIIPLATLADGSTHGLALLLIVNAYVVGAAQLLGARMYVPEIMVTELDVDRLTRLLDVLPPGQRAAAQGLEAELARAHVVDPAAIPSDVVTMNTRVLFEDEDTGKQSEAVLAYPHGTGANGSAISILAPVGTALLGLRAGQSIDWPMPSGRCKRLRVVKVVYQPEAAGDFHL